ncbi:MAG: aminotransferase class V-fold PLP-dependent enzyme [Candidatus Mycalebacterium zealandia]|nr:MAG: aminotransferase class V-fold PLP-dependent enzyme [Candidatus Mycalebacterium zealandia]
MGSVYLDYNATTPLEPRVRKEMEFFFAQSFGNPSSVHSHGREARAALDAARERVADFLGGAPSDFVFTSGGSESNNFAVKGAALAREERRHIVTTAVEHSSCREAFEFLRARGFGVTVVPVDSDGVADMDVLKNCVSEQTALVSCMYVNNETGVVMPIESAAEIAKECGAFFHADITQAAGKIPVDLATLSVDLASVSSHKLYGPKGAGVVFVRKGVVPEPLIHGGGQERGRRSGTENVAAIAGFGKACEIAHGESTADMKRVAEMRDDFESFVLSRIEGSWINGKSVERVANTSNFGIDGIDGEALVIALDIEGISVSNGSACSEGNVDPSKVLLAMGLGEEKAASCLRVSMGRFTKNADIEKLKNALEKCLARMERR